MGPKGELPEVEARDGEFSCGQQLKEMMVNSRVVAVPMNTFLEWLGELIDKIDTLVDVGLKLWDLGERLWPLFFAAKKYRRRKVGITHNAAASFSGSATMTATGTVISSRL